MNAKGNNTKSRFFWFSSSAAILIFGLLQIHNVFAQCELFQLDLTDTTKYSVTCGSVNPAQWEVSNNTCSMTTFDVRIPGDSLVDPPQLTPVSIRINGSGNLECDDYIVVEYSINGVWTTQDSVLGCTFTDVHDIGFNVQCAAGSLVGVRVTMITNDINEKLQIKDAALCIGQPTAMPVQLTSFTLHPFQNGIQLKWNTASENNNSGFEIQRSEDGHHFSQIGFVESVGTANGEYEFMDKNDNMSGTYYYRLKQIDVGGTFAYSFIMEISVNAEEVDKFRVSQHYPNPTCGKTKVDVYLPEDGTVSVMLHNIIGQDVKGFGIYLKQGSHTLDMDVSDLTTGTYFYTVSFSGQSVSSKMLVMNTK